MKKFKSGGIELELKELGLDNERRMYIQYCVSYQGRELLSGDDLSSGSGMYRGLEDTGSQLIDFLICGDFLNEEDRQLVEDNVEINDEKTNDQETIYYIERMD